MGIMQYVLCLPVLRREGGREVVPGRWWPAGGALDGGAKTLLVLRAPGSPSLGNRSMHLDTHHPRDPYSKCLSNHKPPTHTALGLGSD